MTVLTSNRARAAAFFAGALALAPSLFAQVADRPGAGREPGGGGAMTVTGHVSLGDHPIAGASVAIPDARVGGTTNADGWYSFIVPASRVTGQPAAIVARDRRYGTRSATIKLLGGSAVQDFTFGQDKDTSTAIATVAQTGHSRVAERNPAAWRSRRRVDSTALGEIAGPLDLGSALAGRVPGLLVVSASTPGGSSLMVFRGPRSIAGSIQPLIVLDGVPIDNSSFATASQRFGLGGFDYGSPLQDIPLDDVASVTVLSGSQAAATYGARGANGVVVVTSKRGRGPGGFRVTADVRTTTESPLRLPAFQNTYGQGLDGAFEFFNGQGGGINDGVDQSWGPALQGQPVAQASFTEPRRPEVREWLPHPNGVRTYFGNAHTLDVNTAIAASGDAGDLRVAVNARDATGLTPTNQMRRLAATLATSLRPSSRFTVDANVRAIGSESDGRPGTGFDDINPVAGFTRLGRQVDFDSLRAHVRDSVGQINWIYTTRNNPYFQTALNSNVDRRLHLIGGTAATYELGTNAAVIARAGTDDDHETRNFDVASGWVGGYPSALGLGDFSGGGAQRQSLDFAQSIAAVEFKATGGGATNTTVGLNGGIDYRLDTYRVTTAVAQRAGGATAPLGSSQAISGSTGTPAAYLTTALTLSDALRVTAGARVEKPSATAAQLYPSTTVSYDLLRARDAGSGRAGVALATVYGSWWRAGNEITTRTRREVYAGGATPCPASCSSASTQLPLLGLDPRLDPTPELTNGIEAGGALSSSSGRLAVDVTAYQERSSNVLVATTSAASASAAGTSGVISNRGVEASLRVTPLRRVDGVQWDVTLGWARNVNRVEALNGGTTDVPLGPSVWGAALVARPGSPVGAIVGTRFLRDGASHALLLSKGLPLSDGSRSVLGSWQPDWTSSLGSSLQLGPVQVSMLADARIGGRIFSATNLWGSYAGTLQATVDRPTQGLLIAGVDSGSRSTNAIRVSAQDYFHALGGIGEPWVYDASSVKLREARVSYTFSLPAALGLQVRTVRFTLIGRNLLGWAKAPNIDPETTLSTSPFQGFEMGQLPTTRSLGLQIGIAP